MKRKHLWNELRFLFGCSMRPFVIVALLLLTLMGSLFFLLSIAMSESQPQILYIPCIYLLLEMMCVTFVFETCIRHKGIRALPKIRQISTIGKILVANFIAIFNTLILVLIFVLFYSKVQEFHFPLDMFLAIYIVTYFLGILLAGSGGKLLYLNIIVFFLIIYGGNFALKKFDATVFHVEKNVLLLLIFLLVLLGNVISYILSCYCYKKEAVTRIK